MGLPFTYLNQPHVGEMIENHLKEKVFFVLNWQGK